MLQVLIGEHPLVATTVELTLYRFYVSPWLKKWDEEKRNSDEGRWHQGLPFVWKRDELADFLHEFTERVYRKLLASKPGATHVLDKHPPNAMHLGVIRNQWPNARFIHVLRDGRDVACSMISAAKRIGFGARTIPAAAAAWKEYVTAARKGAAYGEDYLEIRYEDLLRDGGTAYARVLNFCRLPHTAEWVETTLAGNTFDKMKEARRTGDPGFQSSEAHYRKGRAGAWQEELSARQRFEFERRAGELLRELGYEAERDWWKKSALDGTLFPILAAIKDRFQK